MPEDRTALWIRCSQCGAKTRTMVYEDTVLQIFRCFVQSAKEKTKSTS